LEFAKEILTPELFGELLPLLKEHRMEIPHYTDLDVSPDFSYYLNIQAAGALRLYSARIDGRLVGYSAFIVHLHRHSKQSLQADEDLIFISKQYREGIGGYSFIKWIDDELLKEGVKNIYRHVSLSRDFSKLLYRLGYEPIETIYARKVG
jgi:hypothetical protein